MSPTARNDARLRVRLPSDLKQLVEQAAATLGQSASDFTISSAVREAQQVLADAQVTRLTNRDRFLEALDSVDLRAYDSLREAATRYAQHSDR